MMHGEYGLEDVVLSFPAIVGKDGIETTVPIDLNKQEVEKLIESSRTLKEIQDKLELAPIPQAAE